MDALDKSILDRITKLLNNRDQKELTEYLNLKSAAFSEWKSGKSKSFRKYLIEIASFFDISIDYLVYGKENSSMELSKEAKECLSVFNDLIPDDQMKFIGRMQETVERYTPEMKEKA